MAEEGHEDASMMHVTLLPSQEAPEFVLSSSVHQERIAVMLSDGQTAWSGLVTPDIKRATVTVRWRRCCCARPPPASSPRPAALTHRRLTPSSWLA